jgi:hypothetical protein
LFGFTHLKILSFHTFSEAANGMAHLTPIMARRLTLKTTFSAKWLPRTHPESRPVEPVLGGVDGSAKVVTWFGRN